MRAAITIERSMFIFVASGIAIASIMAKVPQEVPVEKRNKTTT